MHSSPAAPGRRLPQAVAGAGEEPEKSREAPCAPLVTPPEDRSTGNRCACNQRHRSALYFLSRLRERIPPLSRKNSLVRPGPLFATGAPLLLRIVPAAQELLRCLLVTPLHVSHPRNVVSVFLPVPE